MTFTPKQTYKNRAEAFRQFVQAQNLPVSQSKFYQDAELLHLVGPDGKSIELSSLLAYTREKLKVSPTTGQSLVERSRMEERELHDDRKAKAEAQLKEIQVQEAQRRLDDKWLHRDEAWGALAGLVGTLCDTLRHHFHIGSVRLIELGGGDPQRGPEVYEGTEEILSRAFNEVVAAGRIEGIFEESTEGEGE